CTNDRSSNAFGSTIALFTFVKILNSFATLMSYPYEETPYEIVPCRTCAASYGSIMPDSRAILRIQWSGFILMLECSTKAGVRLPRSTRRMRFAGRVLRHPESFDLELDRRCSGPWKVETPGPTRQATRNRVKRRLTPQRGSDRFR